MCILGLGCSTFKTQPGQRPPTLPYSEPILATSYSVSVQITDGSWHPMCMVPDATNTISCYFTYDYLERSPLMRSNGGYLFLGLDTARVACADAVGPFSVGSVSSISVVQACSRALTMHRWMNDSEYGVGEENR